MTDRKTVENEIYRLIEKYFELEEPGFVPGKTKVPLQKPPVTADEVKESVESLLSTWLVMGKKVKAFEDIFAGYIGVKHGTMLNSGSSANLVALSVLTNPRFSGRLSRGDEVITPAVTWATTVFPIHNVGLTPVLVDVDSDTFNVNVDAMEKAITDKTKALMPVHLLGNPSDMKRIMEIAEDNDLYVIEDSCEAHGAEIGGKKVGSMGDMGTFSFFMSHHITTIEGGMIMTDNEEMDELAKSIRVFGWIRDMKNKSEIAEKHKDIDPRFLFYNFGYNLRPTEIQGAFGIHQVKKIEGYIKIREENALYWNKTLSEFEDLVTTQKERAGTRHSWFSYPITVNPKAPFTRSDMMNFLESRLIETRPIQSGNITQQPGMSLIDHRVSGKLEGARAVHERSFFIGNHQSIGKSEREYVANTFVEFLEKARK